MDSEQEKVLNRLIKENDVQDNTETIKSLKHSSKIRNDVAIIQNIKRQLKTKDFQTLDKEAIHKSSFLYTSYPNIYNKLLKDEIDIKVLYTFLDELAKIENGSQNQHEASYNIGMLLKSLYVDKKIYPDSKKKQKSNGKKKDNSNNLSYAEYKERFA
uniref:Uncharacterized protein n=1 Tax=viral metagenome TaxID=1070528 RepID=A0A6C0L1U1_9ZZZZ|tara:strand:- start:7173 stop:7643 length:471 start_codon:yes stop_codon:yes gene_type:complete